MIPGIIKGCSEVEQKVTSSPELEINMLFMRDGGK